MYLDILGVSVGGGREKKGSQQMASSYVSFCQFLCNIIFVNPTLIFVGDDGSNSFLTILFLCQDESQSYY